MTTNTYLGNGIRVTSAIDGIISACDVALTNASSPYTALVYDYVIRADATSGVITVNLPTAVGNAGKIYKIYRTDILASTNFVTIDGNSAQTIDGNLTYNLIPGDWIHIESDGANWQVIARSQITSDNYSFRKGATADRRVVAGNPFAATAFPSSTTAPATGTLWTYALLVPKTTKFDLISVVVGNAGTGSNVRMGIYRDDGNGYPGALIFDSGSIVTTSTGTKNSTITSTLQIFQPGLYWIAVEVDAGSPGAQFRILPSLGFLRLHMGVDNGIGSGGTNHSYYWALTHTYGTLPDPYTAGATMANVSSTATTPLIAVGLRPL